MFFLTLVVFTPFSASAQSHFRPDRILVMPKDGSGQQRMEKFSRNRTAKVIRAFPSLNGLQVVKVPPNTSVGELIQAYEASGLVEYAEPDYLVRMAEAPNDPRYNDGTQWALNNTGQSSGVADADVDAPEAWDLIHSAENVIVAVVDSGIRYTHEDLAGNVWVNAAEIPGNGIDDDNDGFVDDVHGIDVVNGDGDPWDDNGHGSHVAGIIGAVGNNGIGIAGVAWRVQLMALKSLDQDGEGSISDAIECLDYAREHGAQVINASWAGSEFSRTLRNAIRMTRDAGIIFVAAAGNDGTDNDREPVYPASYAIDNIVAVTSTDHSDLLSNKVNYGSLSVELGAPGTSIYSADSDLDQDYAYRSGTSMATAFVTGAFALMRARFPEKSYTELIGRMMETVDPLPALQGKTITGGRLNLFQALRKPVNAGFAADPLAGNLPLTVHFSDLSTEDIVSREWSFGDGSPPVFDEPEPVHLFRVPGVFEVSLHVTNVDGVTGEATKTITVDENYTMTDADSFWIDPAGMSTFSLNRNQVSEAIPLPFLFVYYGVTYGEIYISANGMVGFQSDGLETYLNTELPNPIAPNTMLCPYWDQLDPEAGGSISVGVIGQAPDRKFVVSFVDISTRAFPYAVLSFQTVLEESTYRIYFNYQKVGSESSKGAGREATIGLENQGGNVGVLYSLNGARLLEDGQTLLFQPAPTTVLEASAVGAWVSSGPPGGPFAPEQLQLELKNPVESPLEWSLMKWPAWLDVSLESGQLDPGEIINVDLSFNENAESLPAGIYQDEVLVTSSLDGHRQTILPVELIVRNRPIFSVASSNQSIELTLRGEPNQEYIIERSSDLEHWEQASIDVTDTEGTLNFVETEIQDIPQRFYRAVLSGPAN